MNTLTDFKKYLATPNARVRLISVGGRPANPSIAGWRTVGKLQTNAVAFVSDTASGLSWMNFPAASKCQFDGNTATLDGLVYECEPLP